MHKPFAIFASLACAGLACMADSPRPWEVHQNILQPVDAGRADVHSLSTSNFVPTVDLRLPTNFERVYRLSDVMRRGADWNLPSDLDSREGFVRFSGGVAAVFNFSRYTSTRRGRVSEIPEGTVFRLDLRPPTPGDVHYAPPAAASYNAVSLGVKAEQRDLRAPADVQSPRRIADMPPAPEVVHSLWTDELYRGRTISDLLDQAVRRN